MPKGNELYPHFVGARISPTEMQALKEMAGEDSLSQAVRDAIRFQAAALNLLPVKTREEIEE